MNKVNSNHNRAMSQPVFIVVVSVLLLAVITFYTAKDRLGLVFKKAAVPQPREFKSLPPVMGPRWVQVSVDEQLNPNIEESLGTEKYLYRDYVRINFGSDFIQAVKSIDRGQVIISDRTKREINESYNNAKVDAARAQMILDSIKDKSPDACKLAVAFVQHDHPDGVVNMGLTYYTGMVDTVAHVPDRCYIADGFDSTDLERVHPTWNLGSQSIEPRLMHFEDVTGSKRVPRTVVYFFNVDGDYCWDPLDVRMHLQSLTQKYGYYAKIELMQVGKDDNGAAAMRDFLSGALPQIQTCLPNWEEVNKRPPAK